MMVSATYLSRNGKRRAVITKVANRCWDIECCSLVPSTAALRGAWRMSPSRSRPVKTLTSAQGVARQWVQK
jgi:hypothetical protein